MFGVLAILCTLQVQPQVIPAIDIAAVLDGKHWADVSGNELHELEWRFLELATVDPEVLLPRVDAYIKDGSGSDDVYKRHVDIAVLACAMVDQLAMSMSNWGARWEVFDVYPWSTSKAGERKLKQCTEKLRTIREEDVDGARVFRLALSASRQVRQGKLRPFLYTGGFAKSIREYDALINKRPRLRIDYVNVLGMDERELPASGLAYVAYLTQNDLTTLDCATRALRTAGLKFESKKYSVDTIGSKGPTQYHYVGLRVAVKDVREAARVLAKSDALRGFLGINYEPARTILTSDSCLRETNASGPYREVAVNADGKYDEDASQILRSRTTVDLFWELGIVQIERAMIGFRSNSATEDLASCDLFVDVRSPGQGGELTTYWLQRRGSEVSLVRTFDAPFKLTPVVIDERDTMYILNRRR